MTGVHGVFLACALCIVASSQDRRSIQVRIENASGEPLRCVAVLAHFVTRTLPRIPGAGAIQVTLERDAKAGGLSYGSHGKHPMMLENLLCGTEVDWSTTARDLPVLPLRSGKAREFSYRCGLVRGTVNCALQ